MRAHPNDEILEAVCHAVKEKLEELAVSYCRGDFSEETFIAAVLQIETDWVKPYGLTLTGSRTRDKWIVFQIKVNDTNDTCAAFEFLPETGEFRRSHSACDS